MTAETSVKSFEPNKCYLHENGGVIRTHSQIHTLYHGKCLVGEDKLGNLMPVGLKQENLFGWKEITDEDFKLIAGLPTDLDLNNPDREETN